MIYVYALGLALQFLGFLCLISVLVAAALVVGSRYQDNPPRAPLSMDAKGLWTVLAGLALFGVGRFLAN